MKHLWLILFVVFVSCEKSKMIGIWVNKSDNNYNYNVQKIYRSNGNYFIDYKYISAYDVEKHYPHRNAFWSWTGPDSLISLDRNYTSTHTLKKQFFSEAYYEIGRTDKDYKPVKDKNIVKLIDKSTILIGSSKYFKYEKGAGFQFMGR